MPRQSALSLTILAIGLHLVQLTVIDGGTIQINNITTVAVNSADNSFELNTTLININNLNVVSSRNQNSNNSDIPKRLVLNNNLSEISNSETSKSTTVDKNLPKFGDRILPLNRSPVRILKIQSNEFYSDFNERKESDHQYNIDDSNKNETKFNRKTVNINLEYDADDVAIQKYQNEKELNKNNNDDYNDDDEDDVEEDELNENTELKSVTDIQNFPLNSVQLNANNSDYEQQRHLQKAALPVIDDNQLQLDQPSSRNATNLLNTAGAAEAHRLEMSTEFFIVPSSSTQSPIITRGNSLRSGGGVVLLAKNGNNLLQTNDRSNLSSSPKIISIHDNESSGLRKEPWVMPILVLASIAMIMMSAFEIFVLCKAFRTSPSRRHLFLGQMLLFGLFSCAGLAAIITASPTLLSCATIRFGAGVAFALVYAALLVKCVFLISLNGGVYLPAPYQGLLLLFAVLIQVAIGTQWLMTSPPAVDNVPVPTRGGTFSAIRYPLVLTASDLQSTTIPLCRTPFTEFLMSLIYVVFLILFVAILAVKSRGIRDNYREATYIGLAIGGSIPIWLGWILCGLAVADRHKDACLAFGLIATSTTVFLVMFMPKGRQLAAMGKEGLYVEDREEQFSSISRAGSGYSPSFFHFKPIKYGVMGSSVPHSNTNTGNGTTSKQQAIATLGGGEYNCILHFYISLSISCLFLCHFNYDSTMYKIFKWLRHICNGKRKKFKKKTIVHYDWCLSN